MCYTGWLIRVYKKKMANFLRRLLNPQAGYKGIPSLADSVAAARGTAPGEVPAGARNRIRWQDVVFNIPFMLGSLIV